jgi:hypothetical protein
MGAIEVPSTINVNASRLGYCFKPFYAMARAAQDHGMPNAVRTQRYPAQGIALQALAHQRAF